MTEGRRDGQEQDKLGHAAGSGQVALEVGKKGKRSGKRNGSS